MNSGRSGEARRRLVFVMKMRAVLGLSNGIEGWQRWGHRLR